MKSTEMTQPRRQDTPHKEGLSLVPSTQFQGHQVPSASIGTCILDVHKEKKYKIKKEDKNILILSTPCESCIFSIQWKKTSSYKMCLKKIKALENICLD